MAEEASATDSRPSAGVLRRFGAMFYDLLVLIALTAVSTFALLPFTGGEAILRERYGVFEYAYQGLLVAIIVCFFGLFWTRQGQTIGMLAWRVKIERDDGRLLTWADVFKRLASAVVSLALVGAGYFWIWIDRDKLAWPDRWTHTRVVVLPKKT